MKKDRKSKSGIMLVLFFLLVIFGFAGYNAYEMVFDLEACGQKKGLAQMSTLQRDAVNLWGGIQRAVGMDFVMGAGVYADVTRLDNGQLLNGDPISDVSAAKEGITIGVDLAKESGAYFLYVQAPSKLTGEEELPYQVLGFAETKYDQMMEYLQANEIPYIGMRDVLRNSDEEYTDYFFNTDHHWRTSAAFLCYQQIAQKMQELGFSIDEKALDETSYSRTNYEQVFLGSHARQVGPLYGGLDDYELWLPKFETSFEWRIPDDDTVVEGSFEECFLVEEYLEKYSFDYYAYYAFFGQDYSLMEIENCNKEDGAHVILVKDSMAVPVQAFLMHQCSELDVIDLRYSSETELKSYIIEQNPDMIIFLFGTGYLNDRNVVVIE